MSNYIPSFYFYKFASAVSAPYTNLEAYKSGAIDENGNILGNEGTIDEFEYFVIKLKKIFEQLPAGTTKYKLQNLYGVIQLFSEEVEKFKIPKDQFNFFVESQIMLDSPIESSYLMLTEDMTTGGIAGGIGTPDKNDKVNTGIVSGYDPVLGFSEPRSSPINMISSVEMFNVSPQEFKSFKNSKTWKYVPDSKTKNYLQRYQRRNKQAKMAVRDEETGEVYFIPYKEKTFVEEFGLRGLGILQEDDSDLVTDILGNTKDVEVTTKRLNTALDMAFKRAQKGRTKETAKTVANAVKKNNIDPESVDPESLSLGAEASETAGGFADLMASMPHFQKLMKTSAGARFAANFLGGYLHTAKRENSNDPTKLDSMRLVDRDDPMWGLVGTNKITLPNTEIGIVGVNQRSSRATGPVLIAPTEIMKLPGAPAEDMEEYSKILRTGKGDPEVKRRIERFMGGQAGIELGRRTQIGSIRDKNIPVQVFYQAQRGGRPTTASPFFASPEAQIGNITGRSGRFRLGKTGKIPNVTAQYQVQQPEAKSLRDQRGTFSPVYAENTEIISTLKNMGIDPSKQLERLTAVLSGRVGSNYRNIMREILSKKD